MDPRLLALLQLSTLAAVILNVNVGVVNADAGIGVNYGLLGNNLPPPPDVINLYKANGIKKLRLFNPNPDCLNALRNSRIDVVVGIENELLSSLAASQDAVNAYFNARIQPYLNDVNIKIITVGNEVIPGEYGAPVLAVMQHLYNVLQSKGLQISISTTLAGNNLAVSYPPSASAFTPQSREQLVPVLRFLSEIKSPILVNVYPYFAYASDPVDISRAYALFESEAVVVRDGPYEYKNLFDAMFDAFAFAMEREGVTDVEMQVSESGWPSAGNGEFTTPEIAGTYNRNFRRHVTSGAGTPKRPNRNIEGYVFAMFNENQKPEGTEQNFGLFYPDKRPVYPMFG